MKPITVAVIGCGYWGRNLARNFHDLGALHTLCDTRQSVLDSFGADYAAVQKIARIASVLDDPSIGAIAIAAPVALHYGLAKDALLAE